MKTKIVISFESKNQIPYLMIIKEYYKNSGAIAHAEVLYKEEYVDSDVEIAPETIIQFKDNVLKLYGSAVADPWL